MWPSAKQSRPRTPVLRVGAITVAAALLLGCQPATPEVAEATPTASTEEGSAATPSERAPSGSAPSEGAPVPGATDGPSADPAPGSTVPEVPATPSEGGPGVCDAVDGAAIDEVIGNQLAAFAGGDFAGALGFATPGFQESFPLEEFEAMITQSFPVPATATGHEILECQVIGTAAAAVVVVTGDAGTQALQYGLLELADGWRIDGAVPLDGVAPGEAPAEVI